MKAYQVQYILPVDNPESNVTKKRGKTVITFFVPINHPLADSMGIRQLLDVAQDEKLLTVLPELNKNKKKD